MIRELGTVSNKYTPANYTAAAELVTGMGVQIDVATGKAILPKSESADGIYFVEKERIATGMYAGVTNLDDYFEQFVTIAEGDFVKMIAPMNGELYAVDQYGETVTDEAKGKRLAVGTDGKWTVATDAASRFVFDGFYTDGVHKLAQIRVTDTAVANG